MAQNDNSIDEINAALTKAVKGTHPEGQDPALGILIAWGNLTGIPLDVFLTQQEMTPEKAAEILSNTPTTTEAKTLQFVAAKVYLAFAKSGKEILGLDKGYLSGSDTLIVHVEKKDITGLKVPSGNESGVNSHWLPGGYTSSGVAEATMNFSNKPNVTVIELEASKKQIQQGKPK
ncbi:MAG: hypothetical protein KH812_09850 [Proteus hauseri]|nr:hypothetical protein [Proteus hauseri]